ncbi:MAG: DNA polymerase III subunit beta [Planctomycetota bacterium]|jgi:DNA polymerase-3 subunit beta|nr:DNA polymerase III subunit beta [Planctomycetota bacterium]
MKILCDRQQLQDAFGVAVGVTPTKTPKPILTNVLLSGEGDSLELFATDLEISVRQKIGSVKVGQPGKILLPAKEMSALLREISDTTVSLQSEDQRCTLENSSGSFVLLGDDPEQYPAEISPEGGEAFTLSSKRFLEMVRCTSFAAAREETRYAINGVLIDVDAEIVRLVATDGRRLSLSYESIKGKAPTKKVSAVVPPRALQALVKAIPEASSEEVEIQIGPKQISFSFGNTILVSQLLESRFPDYEAVIPKMADTSAEISRDVLEKKLRQVAVLSSGDVRMVSFKFEDTGLLLSAESSGVGRADVNMEVEMKGAGGTVSFNPDYLLDALKVADKEVVCLDMSDDSAPAKFTLGEQFTYVLMPISGS